MNHAKQPVIKKLSLDEHFIDESCFITELSNSTDDTDVSIAKARVKPGNTTRWHHLVNTTERYYILSGIGIVEIGEMERQAVSEGDTVIIPPECRQRVTNTGTNDLIFLAICSPRFEAENYVDLENIDLENIDSENTDNQITGTMSSSEQTSRMIIDVYKSTKADDLFLSVPAGTDLSRFDFPSDINPDVLEVSPFKQNLELNTEQPRMGLNQAEIIKQINHQGFAIHGSKIESNVSLSGSGFM